MERHPGQWLLTSTVCTLGMGSKSLSQIDSESRRMKEGERGGVRDGVSR